MRQRPGRLLLAGAVGCALALSPSSLRAETTICTVISSLPYTISAQGSYCLDRNLSTAMTTGNAITISVDFVVLDLNGFKIGGGSAGLGTQANGVRATNHKNITVKNGNIRGFYRAVFLEDTSGTFTVSQGHLVEDVRADQNTFEAIRVEGRGNVVRNNQVVDTTGTTVGVDPDVVGLKVVGPGSRILNNDVTETVAVGAGNAFGIEAASAEGAVIENNRVGNSAVLASSTGISIEDSQDVMVAFSRLARLGAGIVFSSSTGKYTENLTSGVTVPYAGGTGVGDNF